MLSITRAASDTNGGLIVQLSDELRSGLVSHGIGEVLVEAAPEWGDEPMMAFKVQLRSRQPDCSLKHRTMQEFSEAILEEVGCELESALGEGIQAKTSWIIQIA